MADLDQIVGGVAARLETIPGLNVAQYFRGSITPPMAVVGVPSVTEYHAAMGRSSLYQVDVSVHLFTSSATDEEGQRALARFAAPTGASSVREAVEADRKLGDLVQDCIVREFRPLNLEEYAALQYFGGVFTLQIVAKG